MPQIFNLGGVTVQSLEFLNVDRIVNANNDVVMMEVTYNPADVNVPDYLKKRPTGVSFLSVNKIITKTNKEILVDNIIETTATVSNP